MYLWYTSKPCMLDQQDRVNVVCQIFIIINEGPNKLLSIYQCKALKLKISKHEHL